MSNLDAHNALIDAAMKRDLQALRRPRQYPATIASRMAPRPGLLARIFGRR